MHTHLPTTHIVTKEQLEVVIRSIKGDAVRYPDFPMNGLLAELEQKLKDLEEK